MGEFLPSSHLLIRLHHEDEAMPFELAEEVVFKNHITEVTIQAGFRLDFASVPRPLWWLFPRIGRYAPAALVHDAVYREGKVERVQADALFLAIMAQDKTPAWQRWPMYLAVRAFGWMPWRRMRRAADPKRQGLVDPLYRKIPVAPATRDDAIRSAIMAVAIVLALLLSAFEAFGQCGPNGCFVPPYQQPRQQTPGRTTPDLPAQSPQPAGWALPTGGQRVVAATVRICHTGPKGVSLGSGTLIAHEGEYSYVLTCSHLFDEGPGKTTVEREEQRTWSRVIARDRPHDLALLQTGRLRGDPVDIADPSADEVLYACGFGQGGTMRAIRGRIAGYSKAVGAEHNNVRIRGSVRRGDSGGPLFNAGGQLVGVVWGQRDGESYAMHGGPIRRVLGRLFPVIAERRRAAREGRSRPMPVERSDPIAQAPPIPRQQPAPIWQTPTGPPPRIDTGQPAPPKTPNPEQRPENSNDWAARLAGLALWSLPKLATLGAGVGSPIGVGLIAAAWLRRRRESRQPPEQRRGGQEAPRDDGFPAGHWDGPRAYRPAA